jgi:hypothetical protein
MFVCKREREKKEESNGPFQNRVSTSEGLVSMTKILGSCIQGDV